MSTRPFPVNPIQTAIAIGYVHQACIADQVFPYVPVGGEEFKYMVFNMEDTLTVPDTKVGRKGKPNQVEFGATDVTESVEDWGLDDLIPQKDIDTAPPGYDPVNIATSGIMKLVKLDREVRTRNILFDTATYEAANVEDLTATPFSNPATDAVQIIHAAKETMLVTPNQMTFSQNVWGSLQTNPFIIKAVQGNSGDSGIANKAQIEALFELEVIVGRAIHNLSKKGQTPAYQRVWENHAALQYVDPTATVQSPGMTHGMTARFGLPFGGNEPDPDIGLKGGIKVRAGEQAKELLVSKECGYLFQNAN